MPDDPQADSRGEARQSFFAKQQLILSAKTAFQQLAGLLKSSTLYPAAHPFLQQSAEKLLGQITAFLQTRKEVAFYLVGGELFFETISIPVDQSMVALMELFAGRDVGGILFKPGIQQDEIIRFAYVMNSDVKFFSEQGSATEVLAREGIKNLQLLRVVLVDKKVGSQIKEGKKKATEVFLDAVDTVKEIVHSVHLEKAINMRKVNSTVQTMVDNILHNRDALMGLTSIKLYDEYTFAHSVNTAILSIAQGSFLSFGKPQIAALGVAGMLHDIGKVHIPLDIINKPGKLTDAEWAVMKRHPVEGAVILADIPAVTKLAMVAAFEHHQHGGGYPMIDNRVQQHPFAEIIALSDAYDAITAARVYYRAQTPPDQGIRILLKKRGTVFNAVLVKAFVNMIGLFPIGTVVKLDTGEVGLVVHQTGDLMRPRVLLLSTYDGAEKENESARVSLLETVRGSYKRSITGIIDPYANHINVKLYLD